MTNGLSKVRITVLNEDIQQYNREHPDDPIAFSIEYIVMGFVSGHQDPECFDVSPVDIAIVTGNGRIVTFPYDREVFVNC